MDSGDIEVQMQGEDEENKDKLKDRELHNEDHKEKSTESTIHTVPELLLESTQVIQ